MTIVGVTLTCPTPEMRCAIRTADIQSLLGWAIQVGCEKVLRKEKNEKKKGGSECLRREVACFPQCLPVQHTTPIANESPWPETRMSFTYLFTSG